MQAKIPTRGIIAIGFLIAVIGAFYIATIRDGNLWADDYALYVHHAMNIVAGRAYVATGYVYNPAVPDYGPRAYPPVFPVLLAPICWAYGLSLHAMKVEEVIFFLLSLAAITAYYHRNISWPSILAFIALLGFNPNFWSLKDSVIADIPFLLLFYVTAFVAARSPREGPRWWQWAVATGILLYLCVGTRTIGFTVTLGLVVYELVKYRRLTRFVLTAAGVCFVLILAQRLIVGAGEQSYLDQFRPTAASMWANVHEYGGAFMVFWAVPWGKPVSTAAFGITTCLAALGVPKHIEKGLTTIEAFLMSYLLVVFWWPSPQGLRFLLPLIPFYIFLMFLGLEWLVSRAGQGKLRILAAIPVFLILLSYFTFFRSADYGVIRQADGLPSFVGLCSFIKANAGPGDVFLFRRARALSLFTDRPSAVYSLSRPDQLSDDLYRFHVAYIVTSPIFEEDRRALIPFVHGNSSHLKKVYENLDFQVYRVSVNLDGMTGQNSLDWLLNPQAGS